MPAKTPEQINEDLLRPLGGASARYLAALAFFAVVILAAVYAFGWLRGRRGCDPGWDYSGSGRYQCGSPPG